MDRVTKTPGFVNMMWLLRPARTFESANYFTRPKQGDCGHQTTTSTSRVVTVRGMPSSALAARH